MSLSLLLLLCLLLPMTAMAEEEPLRWIDAATLRLEGRGWTEPDRPFERLPARAEGQATDLVWTLSHHTAGLAVPFVTDAPTIRARWSGGGAMNHMAATGVSGLDLYAQNEDGSWTFAGVGRPSSDEGPTTSTLASGLAGDQANYLLFLPLYQKVDFLEIGIPKSAAFRQPPRDPGPPMLFYGTSITQGGCASRTGMAYPAILRRWLNRESINLGFSGAGKMEPVMAELLAELDASVYVIDCLPNLTTPEMEERFAPFIRKLREQRPETAILIVEHLKPDRVGDRNEILQNIVEGLRSEGLDRLYYLEGERLLAGREEGTVDGIHPTDLGFLRMAEAMEAPLRTILSVQEGPMPK